MTTLRSKSHMNGPRYRQEKKIFKLYNSKIQLDCIRSFGDFLGLYIMAYEDDNSLMRSSFITENPLSGLDDIISHNTEYYKIIYEKFSHYVKNYIFYLNNPKFISKIIAYYGFALEFGLFGFETDKEKAFKHYKLSAQQGSPFGTFKLAQCYEKGVGCKRNKQKALSFYRCCAKLGCIQGLHTFGTILLQNSFKMEFKEESAFFYLQLGVRKANKCYPYVYYEYARYLEYKLTIQEITIEVDYCFQAYYRGAQNECPNCQYRIAQCYENGELNKEIDIQKAFSYYKSAAFNGNIDAQFKIAKTLVEQGEMTTTNFNLAYKYALKAATKGNCHAIKYIILFYKKGLGIPKNIIVSNWWDRILTIHLKQQDLALDLKFFEKIEKLIFDPVINIEDVSVDECEPTSGYIKVR